MGVPRCFQDASKMLTKMLTKMLSPKMLDARCLFGRICLRDSHVGDFVDAAYHKITLE